MKYILYLALSLFKLFRKIVGTVWYYVAVRYRDYSRAAVHNYRLSRGLPFIRLNERPLTESKTQWLIAPYHGANGGYITKRPVSWIEYQFAFWALYGWVDDDSNYDTYDRGYSQRIINQEVFPWLPEFVRTAMRKELMNSEIFGNAFDLGTKRDVHADYKFWSSLFWNFRNTAYNFSYILDQRKDQPFLHTIFGREFGWSEDWLGNYNLVFGAKQKI